MAVLAQGLMKVEIDTASSGGPTYTNVAGVTNVSGGGRPANDIDATDFSSSSRRSSRRPKRSSRLISTLWPKRPASPGRLSPSHMARRPTQQQLFRELMAKFGLEVAQAFMTSISDLTSSVELQRLIAAIQKGDLNAAMQALHIDRPAFAGLEAKVTEAYLAGGQGAVASMPAAVSIGFRFDPGNQRAADWIRRTAGDLITGLTEGERLLARGLIADGMAAGTSPRAVAIDLVGRVSRVTGQRTGGLIGLSGPQRDYVASARAELASTDPKTLQHYLTRGRRDRRYDHVVRAAIRDKKRIDPATARTMTTAYSSRLLKLRGEVIARTEGLPAIRAAKREAYQQLVDDGRIDAATIVRTWHTIKDGRQRDSHGTMDGQEASGLTLPFLTPSGASLLYPGDQSLGAGAEETISCRCDESIAIKATKK